MEAEIHGSQRKIITSSIKPLKPSHGAAGIPVRDGATLPFVVERGWSAPAGYYPEQWFVVLPETREVLHEGPAREGLVLGLQTLTEWRDDVTMPFPLEPGTYSIVFVLGGQIGGEVEVQAVEVPADAAA